jgi:hypothetical protein
MLGNHSGNYAYCFQRLKPSDDGCRDWRAHTTTRVHRSKISEPQHIIKLILPHFIVLLTWLATTKVHRSKIFEPYIS